MGRGTDRTLDVLECLARTAEPISAAALAGQVGIPRPTLFRLLSDLTRRGYVQRDGTKGGYRLGLRVLSLSAAVQDRLDIRNAGQDPMHRLLGESRETVELLVPDGLEIVFVEKMDSPQSMRIFARIGSRFGVLHAMAHGKVALAFMPEEDRRSYLAGSLRKVTERTVTSRAAVQRELERIRRTGWALDHQESRDGVTRFSAPVFDHRGRFVGMVGFAGPAVRIPLRRKREFAEMVLSAARAITANLGGRAPA